MRYFLIGCIFCLVQACTAPHKKYGTEESVPAEGVKKNPEIQRISDAYGFENFDSLKHVSFTFNIEMNGKHFARHWDWNPVSGEVLFEGMTDTVRYNRQKMDSTTRSVDARFVNDKYWLFFPFEIRKDKGFDWRSFGFQQSPIQKEKLAHYRIHYKGDQGYTPGDAYDLYVDDQGFIHEWIYFPKGDTTKGKPATWDSLKVVDGVKMATHHYGPDQKFHLYFTDIKLQ